MWSDLSNDSQIFPKTDNLNDINSAMDHFLIISQLVGILDGRYVSCIYLCTTSLHLKQHFYIMNHGSGS